MLAVVVPAAPGHGAAAVPVLVVDGRGFGHGVGMAQDGALALGAGGATTEAILGHFYPGTRLATARGPVRVVVLVASDAETVVSFPAGGEVRSPLEGRQSPGFPVSVAPGGSVRLRSGSVYRAEPLAGATVAARAATSAVVAQVLPLPTSTTTSTTAPPSSSTTTTAPAPLVPLPGSRDRKSVV